MSEIFPFDNSYARLPERFFARLAPTAVRKPVLIKLNRALAIELDLDPARLASPDAVAMFAGNSVPAGAEPLAMAYAGHQFGNWVPQLGDGRAILLGEVVGKDGVRRDIQLKGSGRTPFSRMGDGRAVLGPVLREYVVSEAMHALGIPTTRALAAVTTGEPVIREAVLPGAVLTRVARAHIRVGTFQFFAARQDREALIALADYAIERCYPELRDTAEPYRGLLDRVVRAQAELIARWMGVGFIHGVMNTDNMSIAGETIDYGPCAFMDAYDPMRVFSSIDQMGRYAFGRQPDIGHWNLACLARAMLPILGADENAAIEAAQSVIDTYPEAFARAWRQVGGAKLGLSEYCQGDDELFHDFLKLLDRAQADFTLVFRALSRDPSARSAIEPLLEGATDFGEWWSRYHARLAMETRNQADRATAMLAVNPAFIARNHQVEKAIQAAYGEDYGPFERLVEVLGQPFDDQPEHADLARPPATGEIVQATFCGT